MASGKYAAISGAVARMQMLENISEHLASTKVPGYKKGMVTFEAKLGEATSGMPSKRSIFLPERLNIAVILLILQSMVKAFFRFNAQTELLVTLEKAILNSMGKGN